MRMLLRIALALALLAALGLLALLVPAHLQIRAIAPPLPTEQELRTLLQTGDGPVAVEYLVTASQVSPRGTIGHTVFLLRWADGRIFMIDAGMDRAGAAEFAELLTWMWNADEGRFHGEVATLLGEDTARVRGVGFTHLHIDHTQGIRHFCAARGAGARLFQTPQQALKHNFNTTEGAALLGESCLEAERLEGGRLRAVPGFPGLGAVALGGHTPGSTLFAAAVGGQLWLFSGDTTNTRAAILEDQDKPWLYSHAIVPENTARTAVLRRWLRELDAREDIRVVVSHDLPDIAASGLALHRGAARRGSAALAPRVAD